MEEKTYYDQQGRIVYAYSASGIDIDVSDYEQYPYIELVGDPRKQYVNNGELLERLPNPAEVVGNTIVGVPVAGELVIEGTTYPIAAGDTELDFSPGVNRFALYCFPYLDKHFEVVV
jgi:hypothetical protein